MSSNGGGIFRNNPMAPAAAAQRHYRPEITINDGPTAAEQQQQTPQVQSVAVPQASLDKQNSYQLTQAQLSPALTPAPNNAADQNAVAQRLVGDFQRLFSGRKHSDGDEATLGFAPNSKMASEHAQLEQKSSKGNIKYQFQVTKLRSWRTGYQRLLVLYDQDFATLDPDTLVVTNRWSYNNLSMWQALKEEEQILLQVEPDQTKLKFTCHAVPRASVLTALLECQDEVGLAPNRSIAALEAQRWTRHGTKYGVQLFVKSYGVQEVYQGRAVQMYRFKDIRGISLASGNDSAVVLHFRQPSKWRLYEVYSQRGGRSELIGLMQHHCQTLGLTLSMEHSVSIQDWIQQRRSVDIGIVATAWPVTKTTFRPNTSQGVLSRHLAITSRSLLVEQASGGVVSCHKLTELIALVRHRDSDQLTLEYANGSRRTYASPQRDGLIVSVLDAGSTAGHQIILSDTQSLSHSLAWKWEREDMLRNQQQGGGPNIFAPIAIPLYCLKRVHTVSTRAYAYLAETSSQLSDASSVPSVVKEIHGVLETCREFNASIPPDGEGLPVGNNEKTISGAIGALWGLVHALLTIRVKTEDAEQIGSQVHERRASEEASAVLFESLYRLSGTPSGYQKTSELTTFQECLPHIVGVDDVFAKFWAFRVLSALVVGLPGERRDRETEYVNKSVVLKSGGMPLMVGLVESLTSYEREGGSDLMQMVTSDLLQSLLCSHYDTTSPESFSALIQALSENHRALLATLRSPTPFILENTALLLQVISLNAPDAAARIRDAALSSAVILKYFHGAIFSPVEGYRFLSRYLCSLWFSGPMDCPEKRLLKRMVPPGFLPFLNMPGLSQMEQDQLDQLERDAIDDNIPESSHDRPIEGGASGTNTARLRSRIAIAHSQQNAKEKKPENYRIFFHVLTQDHSLPDLIWSQQTRRELRIALETEIQYMQREIEARGDLNVAWNYQQFSVSYPSLDHEVRVGNVYMRLWLQAGDGFIRSWDDPAGLFELLFRRFLCVVDRDYKVTIMCIRCMQRLYAIHSKVIGPVPDLMILIHSMAKTKSVETQHRLLELVAVLLGVSLTRQSGEEADVPDNAEQMLNSESIGQLCQFAAWGHNTGEKVESILSRTVASQNQNKMITEDRKSQNSSSLNTTTTKTAPPVWFVSSSPKSPPPVQSIRGPYTVADLRRLVSENDLTPFHLVTASHAEDYDGLTNKADEESHIDTGKWKRLNEVWQLRWFLCMDTADGEGVLTPSEVALLSLKALARLVELHRSVDSSGAPYIPIPTAKRILSGRDRDISAANDAGANPLSILSQSLLCNDSRVVAVGANLVYKLLQHNQGTMSKLYLSGIFFFALSYTGSNFSVIARLLECSHLNQHFQSGYKATAGEENSMRDRSSLGSLLPEGLLYVLVNYGYEKFSEIFTGEADTPEVIWSPEMRAHLVEMIRQHLGNFPLRLLQNNTAEYEFCPIPSLSYQRLRSEIFCHNFYLSNLCDEAKFPDWPIAEPVKVFKACLEKFEEAVGEEGDDEADAIERSVKLLELKDGDGDKELRRSYRKLARQYHPDKNPAGREMFETIQKSYELLLRVIDNGMKIQVSTSVADGGDGTGASGNFSGFDRMRLLVKAQLLICQRYEADMKKMQYPSYSVLLGCLQVPANPKLSELHQSWARRDHADFVRAAVELVFRTCLISPQNANEIISQSGMTILCSLLRGALDLAHALGPDDRNGDIAPRETFLDIVLYSLRTISGILFFDNGREALNSSTDTRGTLMHCFYDSIYGSRWESSPVQSAKIKQAALEGICHLTKDAEYQRSVVEFGLLWPLIGCVLLYDSSVESEVAQHVDISNVSAATNSHAMLAVQAIGDVDAALLTEALDVIFTPPLSNLLRSRRYKEFLYMVNSNVEEAYVIWNASMRSQLEVLIQKQMAERSENPGKRPLEEEVECLKSYQYEALVSEVIIGGVYVRVFNKVGVEAISSVNDITEFATSLIAFAKREVHEISSDPQGSEILDLSVGALNIVIKSGTVDDDFLASSAELPDLVFSLMNLPEDTQTNAVGCEMGCDLSKKQGFADTVARQGGLWRLIQLLEEPEDTDGEVDNFDSTSMPKRKHTGWSMLEAMSAYGPVTALLLKSSCWLELLGVLCGYKGFTTSFYSRVGAAKALSRMLWDNAASSSLSSALSRFLPFALVALLKDSPEVMVTQFDREADSPELIWDSSMRSELRSVLSGELDAIIGDRESLDPASFDLDPTVEVFYEKLHNEVYVGGVYISRFLKDPTYQLRDPMGFLDAVLKQRENELEKFFPGGGLTVSGASTEMVAHGSEDSLHDLTTAAVYVCKVRDTLCDKLASWGYCSRSMESIQKALDRQMLGAPLMESVRLLHVATNSRENVDAISSISNTDGTHGIVDFMIKAIGGGPLHADAAFLVELLFLLFKHALGDVSRTGLGPIALPSSPGFSTAMAPSPAPGGGPTRHNREKISLGDDPLAMFGMPTPGSAAPAPVTTVPPQRQASQTGQVSSPYQGGTSQSHQNSAPAHSRQHFQQHSSAYLMPQPNSSSRNNSHGNYNPVQHQPSFDQQQLHQAAATQSGLYAGSGVHQPQPQQHYQPITQQQYQRLDVQTSGAHSAPSSMRQHGAPVHQHQRPYQGNFHDPLWRGNAGQYQQFPSTPMTVATSPRQPQLATPQMSDIANSGPGVSSPMLSEDMTSSTSIDTDRQSTHPSGSQLTGSAQANWGQPSPQTQPAEPMRSPSPSVSSLENPPNPQKQSYESVMGIGDVPRAPPPAAPPPPPPGTFAVETVTHEDGTVAPSGLPQPMNGTGIDARSPTDPTQTAEERAVSTDGAPGAATGRLTLLHQALACQLCRFLVNDFLENVSMEEIKDPAAGRVHAVNLLKLLTMDPGYGMKFKLILKDLPAWSRYKSQDHSLLLATTKRTDYFLTAGEQANPTLMLTEGAQQDDSE